MFIFASFSSGVWGDGVGGVENQKSQLFQENLFALLGANFIPVRVGTLHYGRTILSRETNRKSFKFFFSFVKMVENIEMHRYRLTCITKPNTTIGHIFCYLSFTSVIGGDTAQ